MASDSLERGFELLKFLLLAPKCWDYRHCQHAQFNCDEDQTQGFKDARQAHHHLTHIHPHHTQHVCILNTLIPSHDRVMGREGLLEERKCLAFEDVIEK